MFLCTASVYYLLFYPEHAQKIVPKSVRTVPVQSVLY